MSFRPTDAGQPLKIRLHFNGRLSPISERMRAPGMSFGFIVPNPACNPTLVGKKKNSANKILEVYSN
jgi:hypothetical protein